MSNKTPGRRRLFTIITVFTAILFVQQLLRTSVVSFSRPSVISAHGPVTKISKTTVQIEGQWKHIRQSLGLPLLPDEIAVEDGGAGVTPSESVASPRFFRFKRLNAVEFAKTPKLRDREGTMEPPTELYFAQDALQEQRMSYEELRESFRLNVMKGKAEPELDLQARRRRGYKGQRP
ncbi:hypothetical protein AAF712_002430 [Marasmius tenuissimus]|uniref:Transmembrane protein n=1 Tax=Marasmius tenuissimus TaxID=585030 RepID=A0ABR3A9E7_9AGAR